MIYNNDVVPDNEWHLLREKFRTSGIVLSSGPSAILFHLKKRPHGSGYDPNYFGAFALPERKPVAKLMREFVSICITDRSDTKLLLADISRMLEAPNLIALGLPDTEIQLTPFENPLHAPIVFLSYSHADSDIVSRAYGELKRRGVRVWLDKYEIPAGARIMDNVKRGLDTSDALLLFLSKNSSKSSWLPFKGAYLHGKDESRPIIPIVLDGEGKNMAEKLPFTIGRLYINMTDSSKRDEAFEQLAERVRQATRES